VSRVDTRVGEASVKPQRSERTIVRLWLDAVAERRDTPAYLAETPEGWRPVSWAEAATIVDELAHGLLAAGIRKGEAVAIFAGTSLEWVLFDFALALVGAVGAPIYMNSSPRDARYIAEHSDAVAALCEGDEQRAMLEPLGLEHVFTFDDLDEVRARGRAHAREHPRAVLEAAAQVDEDDLFTFIYTSGTTGPPKGCMIRHRNYYEMVAVIDDLHDFVMGRDTMLLYLPLAHNFGRCMHLAGPYVGYTLAFVRNPLDVAEALTQVRPTVLPSVPRVFEKVHSAVRARFEEETGVRRKLIDWALRVGYDVSRRQQRRAAISRPLALQHRLASRLVYAKVHERLGGNIRLCISGGAPLARDIIEFFHALDVLILEGYGLTECTTAATVNTPAHFRFGTVGRALPKVELRLDGDGELLIRSPTVFKGYHKDEESTRAVLTDDGWLRSGDLATIDGDGYVTITERKKDILVTAGGKNVAPQNLENDLKTHKEISQALVVGDKRPYVAALITLDRDVTARLSEDEKQRRVQQIVDAVNAERSRYEQIKRFVILPRDFSADEDEITPTLKLKRRVCEQHFAADIERLFAQ
jgi:long-chain acyl-CoA synthetase